MKVNELKKIIKPLIKECLKEVLIEEGLVRTINEIKKVTTPLEVIGNYDLDKINGNGNRFKPSEEQVNNIQKQMQQEAISKQKSVQQINENRKKMLDAIGKGGFDAFAGTQPLKEDVQIKASDPGVDINGLMGNKDVWNKMLDGMAGKKGNK